MPEEVNRTAAKLRAVFSKGPPPQPSHTPWGRHEQLPWQREIQPLPEEGRKRKSEEPMAEAKAVKKQKLSQELESSVVVDSQELECSTHYIVYAYANLPVVDMYPPVVQKFLPSTLVQYLQGMGIAPLAKSLAERKVPLAGRIQHCLTNWECITQNQWILDAVQGFKIPFTSTLRQASPPRGKPFSPEEEALLNEEILTMLHKQAIEECSSQGRGFLSSVFLIPKKDGGQRPVINLKSLNEFVQTEHFKMEGIHLLKDLLRQGDWMAKVDLKDAYFTVPIHKQDRDFLKFAFKNKTYRFRCLPFALACAPWVFTKTLKPVAAQLRQLGVRLIVYIGRYTHSGRDTRPGEGPHHRPHLSPRKPGIHSQFPEMCPGTHPEDRFPGLPSRFSQLGALSTRRQDKKDKSRPAEDAVR